MFTRVPLSLAVLFGIALSGPALSASTRPRHTVVLKRADLRLTDMNVAFDARGELYVAYRDKGEKKKSSSLWVRVFDPASGKELRATNTRIPEVSLPLGGDIRFAYTQLLLTPDSSVLVYAEFYSGHAFVVVLDATTLQKISETTTLPAGADRQFPEVISISPDGRSLLIAAEKTNRLNGSDRRLIRLDTRDLSRVLSDVILTNPVPSSFFRIGPNGEGWIVDGNKLYGYDPSTGKATLELSTGKDYSNLIRGVCFLADGSLVLWTDPTLRNELSYLYRWGRGGSAPLVSSRFEGCGVREVSLSPNQVYAVALCDRTSQSELFAGATIVRKFFVFETKTLKPLFQLSFSQLRIFEYVHYEMALWYDDGKIFLALLASSNKLRIYEFAAPRSGAPSAPAGPRDGSLRRRSVPGRGEH